MTIGEKFKSVRQEKYLTIEEASRALGLKSNSHLSMIERCVKDPSPALINNFKATFLVSEAWWETGEPPIFIKDTKEYRGKVREGLDKELLVTALRFVEQLAIQVENKADLVSQYYEDLYEAKYKGKNEKKD